MKTTLYEADPLVEARAQEFKRRRLATETGAPLPSPNLEAFAKARAEAVDWHGTCNRCGHARMGTLERMTKPCDNCGYGK
jgi:hypothetical protein